MFAFPVTFVEANLLGNDSQMFIDTCNAQNNELMGTFCQQSAFSLSAHFYDGALRELLHIMNYTICVILQTILLCTACIPIIPHSSRSSKYLQPPACNCDPDGSNGTICEPIGGQCPCYSPASSEDVASTDRQCSLCPRYFYGPTSSGCMRKNLLEVHYTPSMLSLYWSNPFFPTCTACGCVADDKLCDGNSGQCNCPMNVIGRTCDQCSDMSFGYNTTTGCQVGSATDRNIHLYCSATTGRCIVLPPYAYALLFMSLCSSHGDARGMQIPDHGCIL